MSTSPFKLIILVWASPLIRTRFGDCGKDEDDAVGGGDNYDDNNDDSDDDDNDNNDDGDDDDDYVDNNDHDAFFFRMTILAWPSFLDLGKYRYR